MPRRLWITFLILPATAVLYLGYAIGLGANIGYPLDDAWIHQTFARNLVRSGEFAYNPGEPSTASTSPLWTLMLAVGYLLPGGSHYWAYALGLAFLALNSWVGYLLCLRLFPEHPRLAILAALAILLEWRLNWAALSGMETILFAFACLWLVYLAVVVLQERPSPSLSCLLGAVAGLTALVRPEGIPLSVLALGVLALRQDCRRWLALSLGVWLVLLFPLLGFNVAVGGTPLPSTFYAKNAAYAQTLTPGFVVSYLAGAIGTLAQGPLAVLVPGLVFVGYRVIRQVLAPFSPAFGAGEETEGRPSPLAPLPARERGMGFSRPLFFWRLFGRRHMQPGSLSLWERGCPLGAVRALQARADAPFILIGIWVIVVLVLYMVRLPALFHHGRYLMPLLPPLIVVGLGGLIRLGEIVPFRLLVRVYGVLALAVFLALWINGAVVYGWDVKFIDDEEVQTAMWLETNVPDGALIATHDIGAIGYFSGRRIVDTAGLITPDLGPYVRDQSKILSYLEAKKVDYLVVFPKWYPRIVADTRFEEAFRIEEPYVIPAGADNMVVYQAKW